MSKANVEIELSVITPEMLKKYKQAYPLLASYNPIIPCLNQRASRAPPGKVTLYWKSVTVGNLRLPPSEFILGILKFFSVGFSQLHPHAYQKIVIFEMFFRGQGLPCMINVFRAVFMLSNAGNGWYTFRNRCNFTNTKTKSLDDWRDKYLFIDATVIPKEYADVIMWNHNRLCINSSQPKLNKTERSMFNLCKGALLNMRRYSDEMLYMGNVRCYWPWKYNAPQALCDGKALTFMEILTKESLKGVMFKHMSRCNIECAGEGYIIIPDESIHVNAMGKDEGTNVTPHIWDNIYKTMKSEKII